MLTTIKFAVWIAVLACAIATQTNCWAANRDVCASCTYTTISAAIAAASTGDTIRVAAGTYDESLGFGSNLILTLQGGWDSQFTARDPQANQTSIKSAALVSSNSTVTLDGFTISNGAGYGVNMNAATSNLTVSNCSITNHPDAGIYVGAAGTVIVSDNLIANNCGGNCYGGVLAGLFTGHTQIIVSGNTIYSHTANYAAGVMLWNANSNDQISDNIVHDNYYGINTDAANYSSTPTISGNKIYSNSAYGMILQRGSQILTHNVAYRNPVGTNLAFPGNPTVINNVFSANTLSGLTLSSTSSVTAGTFKNNIFSENGQYGFAFIRNADGSGISNYIPADFSYNLFHGNIFAQLLHSGISPYSFTSEVPGDYQDLNQFTGASSNMIFNPGFIDSSADDYHLLSSSFAVDQGAPASSYALESAPNGGRIDLGAYGNTSEATASPASIAISNVEAAQDGDDLDLSFDTTTPVDRAWINIAYWDGDSYETLGIPSLSGAGAERGYLAWRISTGAARTLTVTNIRLQFDGQILPTTKIRITLSHGQQSASAESSSFSVDFAAPTATPTPTATQTASATPTATPTSTATQSPTETPQPVETPTPAPTATLTPTSAPGRAIPALTLYDSSVIRGRKAKLRYRMYAPDSETLTLSVSIRREGKLAARFSIIHRAPFDGVRIKLWPTTNRPTGRYKVCMSARDEKDAASTSLCKSLRVHI